MLGLYMIAVTISRQPTYQHTRTSDESFVKEDEQ